MIDFQDTLNRTTWTRPEIGSYFSSLKGHSDEGEKAALSRVGTLFRGGPILDVGIGAGRTVPLMLALSQDYRGIDYLPSMVQLAHRRYPDVRLEVGDARKLEGCPDGHFGLVCFSYNGIDSVAHADRALVLRAVQRVLKPGGLFLYSTLNLDGPEAQDRPWNPYVGKTRNPLRKAKWLTQRLMDFPRDFLNWMRLRDAGEKGEGYSVAPLSAHRFGLLVHYTTLARELAQLSANGFETPVEVFESERGAPVTATTALGSVRWVHLLARKPLARD